MIRKKQPQRGKIIIDLTGPDGNAYALMGYATRYAKQIGWDPFEIKQLIDDMKSSDYEHLVKVFDDAFGDFVILER
jgi:hypothetical protein